VDVALFLPATAQDVEKMFEEMRSLFGTIGDRDFRQLLDAFLDDASFCARFKKAPAAKNMHHAYLGGLLEHTLAVCRLVNAVCPLYPALDRDLLLAGAVLHDAGKIEEFSYETLPFNYSDRGRLEGHMVLCVQMIQEKIRLLPSFPEEKATLLKHLVLSHHGRHEFGAPTLPMTLEAFVLNLVDDLDAKINYIGRLSNQFPDDNYQWTDYQRTLERFLFIRRTEDDVPQKGILKEPATSPRSSADQKTEASSNKKEAPSSIQFSLFDR